MGGIREDEFVGDKGGRSGLRDEYIPSEFNSA